MNKSHSFLILSLTAVAATVFAAEDEPPKLDTVPLPAVLVANPEAIDLPQQKEILIHFDTQATQTWLLMHLASPDLPTKPTSAMVSPQP